MALGLFTSLIQAFQVNGIPASGGQLFTYSAGTSTPATTYIDSTGATAFTNPIILNARGEPETISGASAGIWGTIGTALKFVLEDVNGNFLWQIDNVFPNASGAFGGDSGSGGTAGLVPAPPSGSFAADDYLSAGGSWLSLMTTIKTNPTAADVGFLGMPSRGISGNTTVATSDFGSAIVNNDASAVTITIAPDSALNPPANCVQGVLIVNPASSGNITVAQGVGVSLFGPPSNNTAGNRTIQACGQAVITRYAANAWNIVGAGVS